MELWIRSQNKDRLLKVSDLNVRAYILLNGNDVFAVWDRNTILGTYVTEERCFEILDEIQVFMDNANKHLMTVEDADISAETYEALLQQINDNNLGVLIFDRNTAQVFHLSERVIYQMPEK